MIPHVDNQKKLSTTIYITEEQNEKLKRLSRFTKVPMAEYVRQGIDLVLERNGQTIPGQLSFLDLQEFSVDNKFRKNF